MRGGHGYHASTLRAVGTTSRWLRVGRCAADARRSGCSGERRAPLLKTHTAHSVRCVCAVFLFLSPCPPRLSPRTRKSRFGAHLLVSLWARGTIAACEKGDCTA